MFVVVLFLLYVTDFTLQYNIELFFSLKFSELLHIQVGLKHHMRHFTRMWADRQKEEEEVEIRWKLIAPIYADDIQIYCNEGITMI